MGIFDQAGLTKQQNQSALARALAQAAQSVSGTSGNLGQAMGALAGGFGQGMDQGVMAAQKEQERAYQLAQRQKAEQQYQQQQQQQVQLEAMGKAFQAQNPKFANMPPSVLGQALMQQQISGLTPKTPVSLAQGAQLVHPITGEVIAAGTPKEKDFGSWVKMTAPDGTSRTVKEKSPEMGELLQQGFSPVSQPDPNKEYTSSGLTPKASRGRVDYYAKIMDPTFKSLSKSITEEGIVLGNLDLAARTGKGTADIAAINAFQRIVDPGVSVRGEDVAIQAAANSLIGELKAWAKNKKEGDILSPEIRERMALVTNQMMTSRRDAAKREHDFYKTRAEKEPGGFDWNRVVPQDKWSGFFPSQGSSDKLNPNTVTSPQSGQSVSMGIPGAPATGGFKVIGVR